MDIVAAGSRLAVDFVLALDPFPTTNDPVAGMGEVCWRALLAAVPGVRGDRMVAFPGDESLTLLEVLEAEFLPPTLGAGLIGLDLGESANAAGSTLALRGWPALTTLAGMLLLLGASGALLLLVAIAHALLVSH